jgi:hypothetical protein
VSIQTVLDGIATYLGGPYDATLRSYRTSPIPGVGVVRRAWAKSDNHADYYLNMPPGTRTGSQIVVTIPDQVEYQETLGPPTSAIKRVQYSVDLNVFVRSASAFAEDAQDDIHALRDAILAHLRADRTLGRAVFQAGPSLGGSAGAIAVHYGQPSANAEVTKSFLAISFTALELITA